MPGIPKDRAFEEGVLWRCLFASVSPTVGRNAEKNFELTICKNKRLDGKRKNLAISEGKKPSQTPKFSSPRAPQHPWLA